MSNYEKNQITLVNLPHLLLQNIIRFLNDNLDILCFSLISRRLFFERDRYLVFSNDTLTLKSNSNISNLRSYQKQYETTIAYKNNCILNLDSFDRNEYDYNYNSKNLDTLVSIDDSISKIIITFPEYCSEIDRIRELVSTSKITHVSLFFMQNNTNFFESKKIPSTSSYSSYSSSLSSSSNSSNHQFSKIKSITTFFRNIEDFQLPTSIERLKLFEFSDLARDRIHSLINLRSLKVRFHQNSIDISKFPAETLTALHLSSPITDTKQLQRFTSLRSLQFQVCDATAAQLEQGHIPSTVTDLRLTIRTAVYKDLKPRIIPKSTRKLALLFQYSLAIGASSGVNTMFHSNGSLNLGNILFFSPLPNLIETDDSKMLNNNNNNNNENENMVIDSSKDDNHHQHSGKLNLKKLTISSHSFKFESDSFPDGIETLNFQSNSQLLQSFSSEFIPKSVKTLSLPDHYCFKSDCIQSLPPTIETLNLNNQSALLFNNNNETSLIPPTVRYLKFYFRYNENPPKSLTIPKSVQAIKIIKNKSILRVMIYYKLRRIDDDDNFLVLSYRNKNTRLNGCIIKWDDFINKYFKI